MEFSDIQNNSIVYKEPAFILVSSLAFETVTITIRLFMFAYHRTFTIIV